MRVNIEIANIFSIKVQVQQIKQFLARNFIYIYKPWIRRRHPSISIYMHFQRAGFGVVQTRLNNQNHLKFTDTELKLTQVHVARKWSRNRSHQSMPLQDGVKVVAGILPGAGVASEPISVDHPYGVRHQSLSRFWCRLHP